MNFQPQQSIGQAGGDIASSPATGTHELGGAGLSASVEGQLSHPGDVSSAHNFFAGDGGGQAANALGGQIDFSGAMMPSGAESAAMSVPLPTGAESAAFAAPMMPGSESQALVGLVAGANEPISPLIQMIMRMPGAMGLLNSFFEFFSNFFFSQTSIFDLLNPAFLGAQVYSAISQGVHHMPLSLSILPGNAPIFSTLNGLGQPMLTSDLLSHKLNLSLGNAPVSTMGVKDFASFRSQFNVNGTTSLNKAVFEGAPGGAAGQPAGILSGPGMTDSAVSNQIAGNSRLFSDKIGGTSIRLGPANSNAASVATTNGLNNSSVNLAGVNNNINSVLGNNYQVGEFGQGLLGKAGSVEPAGFNYGGSGDLGQTLAPDLGPSGAVSDQLGQRQLLAMDNSAKSFGPTISDAGERLKTALDVDPGASDAAGQIGGLKAKQLTLDGVNAPQKVQPTTLSKPAPTASHANTEAQQTSSHGHSAAGHSQKATSHGHHRSHADHKVEHKPAHRAAHSSETGNDHKLLADAKQPDMVESSGEMVSYTVQKGDNLWNIARDHLGDGVKWQEIFQHNQDVLGSNPDLIYPGTTIELPGQMADIAQNGATTYTVQPGDNLWDISEHFLGEGHQWGDIYSLNQNVIGSNPSLIHPGQQLSLPQTDPTGTALSNAANQPMTPTGQEMTNTAPVDAAGDNSMAETFNDPGPATNTESMNGATQTESYRRESLEPMETKAPEISHEFIPSQPAPGLVQAFKPTISQAMPATQTGLPVIPNNSQPIPAGPGSAQAATINSGNKGVVSAAGLYGDLTNILNGKK